MFVKMSALGVNMYLYCQRKYWHNRIGKTDHDVDFQQPSHLDFGLAYAECHRLFGESPKTMTSAEIIRVCEEHGLDINKAAQLMAVLRKHYATFEVGKVIARDQWLEHNVLVGKISKLVVIEGKTWIVEDESVYDTNMALRDTLKLDTQLCLYAACQEQFSADGIIYRTVTKPKQRRKKEESWQDYTQRCECDALEVRFSFDEIDVKGCLDRIEGIRKEIEGKESQELFVLDTKNCLQFQSPCQYYSRCHGKTYTEAQGDW